MNATPAAKPEPSPEQIHRRQAFWQIYLPLFFGAAIFLAVGVWAVVYTTGYIPQAGLPDQQTPAAKVAVIWILLAPCFGGLIQLVLLAGVAFALAKGIHGLPSLAHQVQTGVNRVSMMVRRLSDQLSRPVIQIASQKSGIDRFFEMIAFWKRGN